MQNTQIDAHSGQVSSVTPISHSGIYSWNWDIGGINEEALA